MTTTEFIKKYPHSRKIRAALTMKEALCAMTELDNEYFSDINTLINDESERRIQANKLDDSDVRKFMLIKYPPTKWMDCPINKNIWPVFNEYIKHILKSKLLKPKQ